MPRPPRSIKILKAVSSPTRLQILNLLFERGPLSYTEIMNVLRLNPTRDAGRFAYHLKALLKTNLIEPDVETKKYRLTELGKMMLDISDEIEEKAFRRKKMLVRTSRLSMEEFDRNRIAESLVKEAGMPADLAQKIARAAEKRLQAFKTKYLTAPLIREIVNAILVEKGLEEYRHKLTRLGLPVYDVTQLIRLVGEQSKNIETVHQAAGKAVIEEYTLLSILPRDIADAHTSGSLHLENLEYWILKPALLIHDARFYFKNGLNPQLFTPISLGFPPPKNMESALTTIANLVRLGSTEIINEQCLDYFNVFLAPFAKGLSITELKEKLKVFLISLNQIFDREGRIPKISLGIELTVPEFLSQQKAVGGEGFYADYVEESSLVAFALLELISELNEQKPIFNPSPIIKIRSTKLKEEQEEIFLKAHTLAVETGLPCFANLLHQNYSHASFSANGFTLIDDWHGDWELDVLRTGCLGSVILNLPRIAYEADGDQSMFWRILDEQLEMASRALEIKYRTIRARLNEGLLPFLVQKTDGDPYFRLGNAVRLISHVGLNEAVKSITGKTPFEDSNALALAEQITKHITNYANKTSRKPETRLASAISSNLDVARRFAELDVERYGWAKVQPASGRENSYYTENVVVPPNVELPFEKRLEVEQRIRKACGIEGIFLIQLPNEEISTETMASITKRIIEDFSITFFAYDRSLTYCKGCGKTFYGLLSKCKVCGSADALSFFSRISARFKALSPHNRIEFFAAKNRRAYMSIS